MLPLLARKNYPFQSTQIGLRSYCYQSKVRVEKRDKDAIIAEFIPVLSGSQFKFFFETYVMFKRKQALASELNNSHKMQEAKKLLYAWSPPAAWSGNKDEVRALVQILRRKFQTQASTMEKRELTEKFLVVLGNVALYEPPSTFFNAREEGFFSSFTDILGEAMGKIHPSTAGKSLSEEYRRAKESGYDDQTEGDYFEYDSEDTILVDGAIEEDLALDLDFPDEDTQEKADKYKDYDYMSRPDWGDDNIVEPLRQEKKQTTKKETKPLKDLPLMKYAIDRVPNGVNNAVVDQAVKSLLFKLKQPNRQKLQIESFSSGGVRSKPYRSFWVSFRAGQMFEEDQYVTMKGKIFKLIPASAFDKLMLTPTKDVSDTQKNVMASLQNAFVGGIKSISFPLQKGIPTGHVRITLNDHKTAEEAYARIIASNDFQDYHLSWCMSSTTAPSPKTAPVQFRVTAVSTAGGKEEEDSKKVDRIYRTIETKAEYLRSKHQEHRQLFEQLKQEYTKTKEEEKAMQDEIEENYAQLYSNKKSKSNSKNSTTATAAAGATATQSATQFAGANPEGAIPTELTPEVITPKKRAHLQGRENLFKSVLEEEYETILDMLKKNKYHRHLTAKMLKVSVAALTRRIAFLMKKGFDFQLPPDFPTSAGLVHIPSTPTADTSKSVKAMEGLFFSSMVPQTNWEEIKNAKAKRLQAQEESAEGKTDEAAETTTATTAPETQEPEVKWVTEEVKWQVTE